MRHPREVADEVRTEPAPRVGVGDDGVRLWSVVPGSDVLVDGEIVERSAEAVAEWVVDRARLLPS